MKKPLSKMTKQEAIDDAIMFAYNNSTRTFRVRVQCQPRHRQLYLRDSLRPRGVRGAAEDFREHCREYLRRGSTQGRADNAMSSEAITLAEEVIPGPKPWPRTVT